LTSLKLDKRLDLGNEGEEDVMQAHRIETTIQPGGTLAVKGLPVREGARVEIIVLVKDEPTDPLYPLRGTPYRFDEPFEPAAPAEDWEAAR